MGTTGIESAELIRNAAEISKPDVIIAIDSLAARNIERINSTIQISDTGISPGAGTGNLRKALNKETTGVKVIAIGIPTVIDAKSIIMDTMEKLGIDMTKLEESIDNEQLNMIVTSSEIDQVIKDFSDIISDAINITVHPGVYS
jgi:spore protease